MKRGTATEMALAVLGVLAWFLLAFSNAAEAVPLAVLQVGIGAWSIAEIVRWQNGHSTHPWSSRRRRNEDRRPFRPRHGSGSARPGANSL
jgi:hypothetical protein